MTTLSDNEAVAVNTDGPTSADRIELLYAQVDELRARLIVARVDHANLVAAVRACVGAYADNEADPLFYLRDELSSLDIRGAR